LPFLQKGIPTGNEGENKHGIMGKAGKFGIMEGWKDGMMEWQRAIPFAASLLLIKPGIYTDLMGLAILGPFLFYHWKVSKKEFVPVPSPTGG
jgi:hypothetical protein